MFYTVLTILIAFGFFWYLLNRRKSFSKNRFFSENEYGLSADSSGELYLLTYNIAGLPGIISSAILPRAKSIREIGRKMEPFDIVNVQEDFNYNVSLYSANSHPYRTVTKGKVPFGDGLNTLSKYPIVALHRVPWADCNGSDCFTPKGFAYVRIQLAEEVFVDVYNLHATSYVSARAVKARSANMKQLADYINEHSEGHPLLVMGDFNAHYSFVGDNMHDFKKQTKAVDPWVDFFLDGKIPEPLADFLIPKKLELTNDIESIDKILYRNSELLIFTPEVYSIEDKLFSTEDGKPLSDHLAVSLRVKWEFKR